MRPFISLLALSSTLSLTLLADPTTAVAQPEEKNQEQMKRLIQESAQVAADATYAKIKADAEAAPKAQAASDKEIEQSAFAANCFRLSAGFIMMNPYHFTTKDIGGTTHGYLTTDGNSSADPYIELFYTNRSAWVSNYGIADNQLSRWNADVRLTLNPADAGDSAAALVGTGDFGLDLALTWNAWRYAGQDYLFTTGPCVAFGGVSSKANYDILKRALVAWDISTRHKVGSTNIYLNLRGGAAFLDTVKMDTNTREVDLAYGDRPKYNMRTVGAIEMEAFIPTSNNHQSGLVLGTRFYMGREPNTWTAYLGYTASIDDLLTRFGFKK